MNAAVAPRLIGRTWLLWTMALALCVGCATPASYRGKNLKSLSSAQIDLLEQQAARGRVQFQNGQYDNAVRCYDQLLREFTVSTPLYYCEKASACWAKGDKAAAKAALRDAEALLEGFIDVKKEKKAASMWGNENEKVYKGDPYEQATLYLMLGLIFLDEGDADNALAAFKSGALADGDVKEEQYRTDFGLLQALQAKCHQMRGDQESAGQCLDWARASFTDTHPTVHAARQAYLASRPSAAANNSTDPGVQAANRSRAEAMAKAAARRGGQRPAAAREVSRSTREAIDIALAKARAAVDMHYCEPMFAEYNTLLLIWHGRAPVMQRFGEYGESRAIVMQPTLDASRYEICVDGKDWADGVRGFANLDFQATTRGGRLMDNVLASQAAFKKSTSNVGDALLRNANTGNAYANLTIMAVGLVFKGISAATKVAADVRCWQSLPQEFHLVPLNLPAGSHEFLIEKYDVLLKCGDCRFSADIRDGARVNVLVLMPPQFKAPVQGDSIAQN